MAITGALYDLDQYHQRNHRDNHDNGLVTVIPAFAGMTNLALTKERPNPTSNTATRQ